MGNENERDDIQENPENKNNNRFLKRNVRKSDLTQQELEILNSLSNPKKAYYCLRCGGFPLMSFSIVNDPLDKSKKKKLINLTLLEHDEDVILNDKINTSIGICSTSYIEQFKISEIINEQYVKNTSDDLLPFETLDDFYEFLKVVIKYKDLKEKIAFYNLGDASKNIVFSFLEFILNIGLYGFGTLYEYHNALSISDFLIFDILKQYNTGFKMENGDYIYETANFQLNQVINIKKVNDNNLYAFIIDVKKYENYYEYPLCGIFLKNLDLNTKGISSIKYLTYNERLPQKDIIVKYDEYHNSNYRDIIELETDKYLLLNDDEKYNLIIASLIGKSQKYHYEPIKDMSCLAFLKLKSNIIFILGELNIYLMKYHNNNLTPEKVIYYPMKFIDYNYYYLIYELSNGDVIFTIDNNKFCYFNMKTFMIQACFEYKFKENDCISKFNQLKNKENYLYCFSLNESFGVNLNNGKIKDLKTYYNKYQYVQLDEYYINLVNKYLYILNENNDIIYEKELKKNENDGRIIIIDQKERLFAILNFNKRDYHMNVNIYKINKNN